ncbi:hypothetical protein MHTCC0001_02190 [Flavobacteriaceae bacterium MHTCC 0001]
MKKHMLLCSLILLITSCKKETEVKFTQTPAKKEKHKEVKNYLPFTNIALNDLSGFKPTGENWKIAGDVITDRKTKKAITYTEGIGILVNTNDVNKNQNLYTVFEHGDIELELDVMVPLGSNSGLYFQSRYEVQIYDSWHVKEPKYKDMGGIYQRWNKEAPKGEEGYEGHSPRVNAAKAPGLWQHIKVIFHAPKFDTSGEKIKNAWFEKVWLNGVLIQENVEVTGPTRAAAFDGEKPRGAFMIQGDHGPVAFKNIKYKLYEGNKFKLKNLTRTEYKSPGRTIGNLDTLPKEAQEKTNSFLLVDVIDSKDRKLVAYSGTLQVPKTGQYLFDGQCGGLAELYLDHKKVLRITGGMDKNNVKTISLKKGDVPFKFIYNQLAPWARGCLLHVEGFEMQRYSLLQGVQNGAGEFDPLEGIIVEPTDKPVMQRSFVHHNGKKYTHCISVGTPQGIHYSYNLATGSLLKVWSGSFLNTTHMWLERGFKQSGEPVGFTLSMHGDLEFAPLENINALWPAPLPESKGLKQLGYELDTLRLPAFSYQIGKTTITNKFTIPKGTRQLNKSITISKGKQLWHKIADGESIKVLPDNIYIINNESFYIDFSGNNLKPIIRNIDGKDELLVEVPKGDSKINYSIIW